LVISFDFHPLVVRYSVVGSIRLDNLLLNRNKTLLVLGVNDKTICQILLQLAKSIPSKVSSFTSTSFANSKSICVGVTSFFDFQLFGLG
jgi:hypothetical protein